MTQREQIVLELLEAIAPTFVKEGLAIQKRLIELGKDPDECKSGGKDIPHAYASEAIKWAEAFADGYTNR